MTVTGWVWGLWHDLGPDAPPLEEMEAAWQANKRRAPEDLDERRSWLLALVLT